jgi:hypothetical protein
MCHKEHPKMLSYNYTILFANVLSVPCSALQNKPGLVSAFFSACQPAESRVDNAWRLPLESFAGSLQRQENPVVLQRIQKEIRNARRENG